MVATRKVKDLTLLGDLQAGDKVVGERTDGTTVRMTFTGGGGSGSAAGDTGNIQYNNADAFAADANFNTDGNGAITVTGSLTVDGVTIDSNEITATLASGGLTLTTEDHSFIDVNAPFTSELLSMTIDGFEVTEGFRINSTGIDNLAQIILNKHSTLIEPIQLFARSLSDDDTHTNVTNGVALGTIYGAGWTGTQHTLFTQIRMGTDSGTISDTSAPGKLEFLTTQDGDGFPTQTLVLRANKDAEFYGNIITTGTVDGRDVSLDGVKLDGIETGATAYTDEKAQDAVGAIVDGSLTYVDGTPLLQRAALTGDVTATAGSNTTTIANSAVTLAKQADVATSTVFYRKTAGSGAPEINTLATLKTDLGLTGTNSGDQTITLTGDVTGTGTGSFATLIATPASATIAVDDKVLIKDTSASNVMKYITTQAIRDLVPGSGTLTSAQLATSLTDETGSGAAVFATSPTLVTPTLGAALATSINFGQDALNYYDEGTWTPTITFDTPGNLSVSYALQEGNYTRIGRLVALQFSITFTPTHTTASGVLRIGGLPFTAANIGGASGYFSPLSNSSNLTYPAGTTTCVVRVSDSSTQAAVLALGSAVSSTSISTAHITTAVQQTWRTSVLYHV